ncbi:MAG: hypothetical protein O7D95_06135 [Betaproteobacteria bacterium]|nr:hypothetical protein [Betaproteobacteria bacterium]
MAHDHDRDIILKITLNAELSKAVALALATNHPFTYDTYKWQASVNGAFYNGENALSLGIAKRFEKIDALWHSSYGQNGGNSAITFGSVWRF